MVVNQATSHASIHPSIHSTTSVSNRNERWKIFSINIPSRATFTCLWPINLETSHFTRLGTADAWLQVSWRYLQVDGPSNVHLKCIKETGDKYEDGKVMTRSESSCDRYISIINRTYVALTSFLSPPLLRLPSFLLTGIRYHTSPSTRTKEGIPI